MVYNRTKEDVESAKKIRLEKVQKGVELTEAEVETLERGTLTINTLNRIETKQEELKNLFNSMGYWNVAIENKTWDYTQLFDGTEFQRIIDNTNKLREAFFTFSNTPSTPKASYYFENINSLEKILYDLDVMINDVKSNYRECGNFVCGEE